MEPATRKVVKRSPGHTVRLLSLPHLQPEPVEADSSLERDFVHLAALFPRIRSIQHQPFTVELPSGYYTPDFLLVFVDGSRAVVEVKPQELLEPHLKKLLEAGQVMKTHDLVFLIALDTQIRKDGRADRALRIRRYSKSRPDEDQVHRALQCFGAIGEQPLDVLLAAGVTTATVAYLLTRRRIEVDPGLRLDPTSLVRIPLSPNIGETDAIRFEKWLAN